MARAARDKKIGLTKKETLFCELVAYNLDMTDTGAYRAAYNCGRMKPQTVNRNAFGLKNRAEIAARINALRVERNKRVEINADWVLKKAVEAFGVNAALKDDDTGESVMIHPQAAAKFLEMVGKHVEVQAFREQSDVTSGGKPLQNEWTIHPTTIQPRPNEVGGDGGG